MIKRAHIRQFLAVVDAGSFTQAAQQIRVTQPALSTGVAELERLVGAQLFIRNRRKIRLTEAGGRFLPIARELERAFRAADGFGRDETATAPLLRIGAIRSAPGEFLQRIVAEFARSFSIEIVEGSDSDLRTALASGRIQIALVPLKAGEGEGEALALYEEPLVMLVPQDHPLASRGEVSPEELAPETMIARRSCEFLDATSRFFTRHGVRPRFSLRSDSDDRCIRMVAAGIGITTAPLSLAGEDTVALRVTGYDFRRELGLLFASDWSGLPDIARRLEAPLKAIDAIARDWQRARVAMIA
ncbi:LysR family transcriptional regulator [Sphingopyxis indica]|uniref:Transcriptional regulator, LysR family n=1 Tax=Sphingopyxis indica TaxID=436663 RepID=A0A239E4K9_9SPHN|nr:LysR family transcriptional regulator [Sphingopyxis indica]SNS39675.1 transcriptional regulator, LysR family [Sphingopyxis indica]